jgi:hypothetical protein
MDHSYKEHHASCGPGYASPNEAMEKAEREKQPDDPDVCAGPR